MPGRARRPRAGPSWGCARTCCSPWSGCRWSWPANPEALTTIRVLGGAYLLYLGGRLIIPTLRRSPQPSPAPEEQVSARSAFGQGLFTNLLNPKAVLFFAAVLPQFLVPGPVPVWVQVMVLGAVDIALGFVAWAVVIAAGVRLAALLRSRRARNWWDRTTGAALGGLGGGLVLTR